MSKNAQDSFIAGIEVMYSLWAFLLFLQFYYDIGTENSIQTAYQALMRLINYWETKTKP